MATSGDYLVIGQKDNDGTYQEWVLYDLDSEWCAAFRIRQILGEPTVTEIRVLPGSRTDYETAVRNLKEPGAPVGEIPRRGLPSRLLREVRPDEARRWATNVWRRMAELSGDQAPNVLGRRGYSLEMIRSAPLDRAPGRRGRSDREYAEIVAAHAAVIESGSPRPNVDLAAYLSERWQKSVTHERVRDWMYEARRRGIARSKPGPTWGLTDKGERLMNEGSSDGEA